MASMLWLDGVMMIMVKMSQPVQLLQERDYALKGRLRC
jgi:hypothetical protein